MIYIIIILGALWGIITLIGIKEENKEIQEMLEAAKWAKSIEDK